MNLWERESRTAGLSAWPRIGLMPQGQGPKGELEVPPARGPRRGAPQREARFRDAADPGHRDAQLASQPGGAPGAAFRDREEQLVVLASGQQPGRPARAPGARAWAARPRGRGTRSASISAPTPEARQRWPRSARRPSETSMQAEASFRRARTRPASRRGRGAMRTRPRARSERLAAQRSRDQDAVARPGAVAAQGAPTGHGPDHGERDRELAGPGHVATDQGRLVPARHVEHSRSQLSAPGRAARPAPRPGRR